MLKYIVLVDRCAASASPRGTLHMSKCVISACISTIVSPYKPALWGTQNLPGVESSTCVGCPHLL